MTTDSKTEEHSWQAYLELDKYCLVCKFHRAPSSSRCCTSQSDILRQVAGWLTLLNVLYTARQRVRVSGMPAWEESRRPFRILTPLLNRLERCRPKTWSGPLQSWRWCVVSWLMTFSVCFLAMQGENQLLSISQPKYILVLSNGSEEISPWQIFRHSNVLKAHLILHLCNKLLNSSDLTEQQQNNDRKHS